MPTCLQWSEERTDVCTETADQGYSECTEWGEACCEWWPCSWGCAIVTAVCFAWTWVENIVCVGWTWVSTTVCIVIDVVSTIVNAIIVTVESMFGWVLSGLAFLVELLLMIPGVGALGTPQIQGCLPMRLATLAIFSISVLIPIGRT